MKMYISLGATVLCVIVLVTTLVMTYIDVDSESGANVRWALAILGPLAAASSLVALGLSKDCWTD